MQKLNTEIWSSATAEEKIRRWFACGWMFLGQEITLSSRIVIQRTKEESKRHRAFQGKQTLKKSQQKPLRVPRSSDSMNVKWMDREAEAESLGSAELEPDPRRTQEVGMDLMVPTSPGTQGWKMEGGASPETCYLMVHSCLFIQI